MTPSLALDRDGRVLCIRVAGDWSIHHSQSLASRVEGLDTVQQTVEQGAYQILSFSAEDLGHWDSSLLLVVKRMIMTAHSLKKDVETSALPRGMAHLLQLAAEDLSRAREREVSASDPGLLELIGAKTLAWPGIYARVFSFLGGIVISLGRFFTGRAAASSRDVWTVFRECGVDALPIVSLISLLLGLILAFVSSIQLRVFGAEVYMAALVGVGVLRVMGPVLTGIVLAGRTGASFAAVLGSMQVNEEVDALVTFGIDPTDFLVLPRVLGLALMTPLLTIYADIMGIMGGFLVGVTMMGIPPSLYWENTLANITMGHFGIGLFHALVFGFVVSLAGCYQGMKCGHSAAAVGQATTAAVVNAIIGIIVSTSIITVLLTVVDL